MSWTNEKTSRITLIFNSNKKFFLGHFLMKHFARILISIFFRYDLGQLCTPFQLSYTAQKMKFSMKDFFSKFDQIRSFLRIWSHLLKKSLMENFIFCAMLRPAVQVTSIVACRTLSVCSLFLRNLIRLRSNFYYF